MSEKSGPDGLAIYCYTQSCTYDKAWNPYTLVARGLVLDHKRECVAATPFPKFFNLSEQSQTIPDLPFEVFDKIDGSLIILFWRDEWHVTTKGTFNSIQAKQAKELLGATIDFLPKDNTYLLEYVGPDNRIVIGYPEPKLYLLSAYTNDGTEFDHDTLLIFAEATGWEIAPRQDFDTFVDLIQYTRTLPATQEGYVVRFSDGLRLKIKGDEYCRIHSLISGATPLGIWELMLHEQDLGEVRRQLPEEFWQDFDTISGLLQQQADSIMAAVGEVCARIADWSDREIGLRLNEFPVEIRRFIFPYRKGKYREALYRSIRPLANQLEGYTPSYAMNRVVEDQG